MVESYLVAGSPLPDVLLSRTMPIKEKYSYEEAAINNASVEIRLLRPDSTIQQRYEYRLGDKGLYYAANPPLVKEQRLYQLFITLPNGDSIEAKTYVPGNFDTVNRNELPDEYLYQGDRQIQLKVTPSQYLTDRQTFYIFTVNAISPDSSELTPFYRDLVFEQDNALENFSINSSGIINEANYDRNADNTISLKVPWLSFAFYGTNKVIINAIDDNMYDFLRTQEGQTGGPSISPGEIQNIRYHVNGGIGIFGSMASDTNRFRILRPDN